MTRKIAKAHPNTAQSCGDEFGNPGLMSFQKVKLPSAPNLYSSLPSMELWALNHNALSNTDNGVESGSTAAAAAVTVLGSRLVPMSVHCDHGRFLPTPGAGAAYSRSR